MAGSVVKTKHRSFDGSMVRLVWTSDGSGDVSGEGGFTADGYLRQVNFIPDSTDDPTNAYDVEIQDSNDLNILGTVGQNLPNTAGLTAANKYKQVLTGDGDYYQFFNEPMALVVSGAGDTKKGTVEVIFNQSYPGK